MANEQKSEERVVDLGLSSFFKNGVNSPQTAYVLGAFVTDGCCGLLTKSKRDSGNRGCFVSWGQKSTDYRWVQLLSKTMCQTEDAVPVKLEMRNLARIPQSVAYLYLMNPELAQDLSKMVELKQGECKSFNLRFPFIPQMYLSHFVRGVLDGDGSITLPNNGKIQVVFSSGSIQFLTDLRMRIQEHCFNGETWTSNPVKCSNATCWELKTSRKEVMSHLLEWIYQDSEELCLKRKCQRYLRCSEMLMVPAKDRVIHIKKMKADEQINQQEILADLTRQALEVLRYHSPTQTQVSLEDPMLMFYPSFLKYAQMHSDHPMLDHIPH